MKNLSMVFFMTVDWSWPASFVKTVFTQDKTFYWQHFNGSSVVIPYGKSGTGILHVSTWVMSFWLCSWARHFTLTVPLSTQEYKWVPANCQGNLMKCWGVTCNGLVSHPGGVPILLVTSCYRSRDKLRQ